MKTVRPNSARSSTSLIRTKKKSTMVDIHKPKIINYKFAT